MASDRPPPALVEAWLTAADDLGIDVKAPYVAEDGRHFAALVAGFGSPKGTLVDWLTSEPGSHATYSGFYVSQVNADAYSSFRRDLFQETLSDWGWALDAESAPSWYPSHAS